MNQNTMAPFTIETIGDLIRRDIPDPVPLVESIIYERTVSVFAGRPKRGKSFMSLALALALSSGRSFLGRFDVPAAKSVLLISQEDGQARIKRRLLKIAKGMGVEDLEDLPIGIIARQGVKLDAEDDRLEATLTEFKPDVVVFDTLSRSHSANENDVKEMSAVFDVLDALREKLGFSVVLLHHERKAMGKHATASIDSLRGSSGIGAYADAVLMFGKEPDPNHTYVTVESKDNDEPLTFVLAYEKSADSVKLTAESVPDRKSKLDENAEEKLAKTKSVLEKLAVESPKGVKPGDVKKALGVALATAREYLDALVDRGTAKTVDAKKAGQRQGKLLYLPIKV